MSGGGDVGDGLADELALGLAEEPFEGRVGAPVAALGVLEEGRVRHDVDHDLHELGHGLVRLVPLGPLGALVGGDGQAPDQEEQGAAEDEEGDGDERPEAARREEPHGDAGREEEQDDRDELPGGPADHRRGFGRFHHNGSLHSILYSLTWERTKVNKTRLC